MTAKTMWGLAIVLLAIPYLLLGAAGGMWLYETGWGLPWLCLAGFLGITASLIVRNVRKRENPKLSEYVSAAGSWPPAGREAWAEMEALSDQYRNGERTIATPEDLLPVMREILELAAKKFHPKSRQPLLEVPLPHVMLVVELVSRDLKQILQEKIPGAHILTIHDLQRLQQMASWLPVMSQLYRGVMFAINPASGIAREIGSYAQGQLLDLSSEELKRWLLQLAVRKTGYYAIELYSGHLLLSELAPHDLTSPQTRRDQSDIDKRDTHLRNEPLRIMVLGQVKAGKSSLINALFGEVKSAVDTVPRTAHLEPFSLERDGEFRAVIFDSAGYAMADHATVAREVTAAVGNIDLILWVCSAVSAARQVDRQLMLDLRETWVKTPDREFPPIVVVLTHIDQLRPLREWSPPYDLRNEESEKVRNIRGALQQVAADLQIAPSLVIPVCLAPGETYNVEDGVMTTVNSTLSDARRLQWQRCLREYRDQDFWDRLWKQTQGAGQVLWDATWSLMDRPRS
ncbi:MAG: GTPase [Planctomycetales bacterium]